MKWVKGVTYTFLCILWLIIILSTAAMAVGNQTNTSGSNTAIEGNYTGGSTTYESGSSSSSTTTNSTTSNIKSAPYTSAAPSLGSMNNCALALSAGVQNFSIGVSAGRHYIDPVCQTINLSKALHGMGMKVAAISVLCGNEEIFHAMSAAFANTPCPIEGKIGKEATKILFEKYNGKMPTYEQYLKLELKRIKEEKKIILPKKKPKELHTR
tara:strand:+ start:142 stop:774 length:633 start_codon:yes stop_codon:yes gene_type:complete